MKVHNSPIVLAYYNGMPILGGKLNGLDFPLINFISAPSVTRAGKSLNPLQLINPKSGDLSLFNNNELVKHGFDYFIGGDTTSVEYKPDWLTSGEASPVITIKRANGGIDPANPPAPTDAVWVTIADQATLDKLKSPNENPIVLSGADGRTITVNGQTLVQQSSTNPAIRDDFAGKQAGSTTVNPNTFKYATPTTSLEVPSSSKFVENSQSSIDRIGVQDGTTTSTQRNNAGEIPQLLLSYNLIREVEDRGLTIPGAITAEKVEWLKNSLAEIALKAYVHGLCPTGNKVKIRPYASNQSAYSTRTDSNGLNYNTASSPTLINLPLTTGNGFYERPIYCIDPNGFVHFLVYTDAARTTDSTLLVLTGHGLIAEDVVFNVNRNTYAIVSATGLATNSLIINASIAGQVAGDTINKYKKAGANKTAEAGTTETNVTIANHGLATGDFVYNMSRGAALRRVTVVDANNFTLSSAVTGQVAGDLIRPITFIGTQTAEATVIPSTVYLDYANIDLQFKAPAGYDIYVSPNPRRDAGAGYVVQMTKVYDNITDPIAGVTNFVNKVGGSNVECPHKFCYTSYIGGLDAPSSGSWSEAITGMYDNIKTLNGTCIQSIRNINNQTPQHLLSMNVIEEVKRAKGWTQLPITYTGNSATDLANEVAWCKANISKLTAKWHGFGSCPSGYKAVFTVFLSTSGTWWGGTSHTNSTVTLKTLNQTNDDIKVNLGADGFMHFLCYTDASDGVTASQINTDYVSLDIEFVKPNTASLFFTGNSVEVENVTAGKASAMLLEFDMTPVCNALVSGDNAAFEALLKGITINAWAKGEGANAGTLAYGVSLKRQLSDGSWINFDTKILPNIALLTGTKIDSAMYYMVQPTNKIYFLVHATYPSDATIASQLSLDYFSLKVDLTRVPDVVSSKQVYMPNEWSLVGEVSPCWDNTSSTGFRTVFNLYKDANNWFGLWYSGTSKVFIADGYINGIRTFDAVGANTLKNQLLRFIFGITNDNRIKICSLINGASISKKTTPVMNGMLSGVMSLYLLSHKSYSNAEGLSSKFALISRAISDTEAENILKGLQPGFTFPNLVPAFSDARWVKHANAVVNADGSLTLNANGTYQTSIFEVPVLPNNRYEAVVTTENGVVYVIEMLNSAILSYKNNSYGSRTITFTTGPNTNKIRFACSNASIASGIFIFQPPTLKLKM